jgi:hypothetical protein
MKNMKITRNQARHTPCLNLDFISWTQVPFPTNNSVKHQVAASLLNKQMPW